MNITYGDFIILQIALLQYLKDLDLSTQSGQYISSLLGKLEYNLTRLSQAAPAHLPIDLGSIPEKPNSGV